MSTLLYTHVFVAGGFPRHTYNPRLGLKLEENIGQATQNLCKLITVTGHTKSGKTVLVRKVFPPEDAIWIDGGGVGAEDDVWTSIINQLGLFQTTGDTAGKGTSAEVSATGKAGANWIFVQGEAQVGGKSATTRSSSTNSSREVSSRVIAIEGLKVAGRALVIDDFHYLPRELQGDLVRALKPLIFDGLPVVVIAIPHRRYDAVKVEREMTGRILPVAIPPWSDEELKFIPQQGFPLLQGNLSAEFASRLARESIGSPHLMQEFCRAICKASGVTESFNGRTVELTDEDLKAIFSETAETIGRPIFEKLARGPRQRSDRISRKLKSGREVDIYGLVLHALAHIGPALVTLEYEDLRSAIREVSDQNAPQLHEVVRVLGHMSTIAATDQSSTPVIDFDEGEQRLHITDPFFAFYLRWGDLSG